MYILIFEGVDNIGKSSLIEKLIKKIKDSNGIVTIIHSTGPRKNVEDPFEYQNKIYKTLVHRLYTYYELENMFEKTEYSNEHFIILDRSWIGEYVYGQLYRDIEKDKLLNLVNYCNYTISDINPVYVYLNASPELTILNDDGKSFISDMDDDLKLKYRKTELDLFIECFNDMSSNENKIELIVENNNHTFRNIDIIYKELIDKLSEKNIKL